ncbi:hypothetical protein JX265_011620 [Neoarthrinium moseri]|uniref:MARVEL domain-containing protein n=1 Tax=Neoarthrinium moseri TaxID=1658444 RepID=A0A9Q0AJ93_9PEZI|nr:uncharacterized protein JN550_011929 [Neoarthrinium moseri]KAI1845511.1 hypothetical protein JX266_008369 [Neoarthrinium moseri]KAI1856373.1 hypothetical protein JX265_011620 [Neoarthrinium moseri]KAI1859621.1 hypothetical protein JN550_011929 [Neoarthrinium moseri]
MLFAVFFAFWRFMQIITLIPTMGMLAWFVNGYVNQNALTPNYILVMFIVSVLGLAWAIFTLFSYHRSSTNALFVSLIDLGFVGAFIAAVWFLRDITNYDCVNVSATNGFDAYFGIFGSVHSNFGIDTTFNKTCAMLKACFAFGIMNCIFFFFTAVLAWFHGDRMSSADRKSYYRETHYHRHGHRRSSHSPHSRRSSHHSHRRVYV